MGKVKVSPTSKFGYSDSGEYKNSGPENYKLLADNYRGDNPLVAISAEFIFKGDDTGLPWSLRPPTFWWSNKKNGKQRKKRKSFKAATTKRLSPRSKCYSFSHPRASRIQKIFLSANHGDRQYFSVFHGPSTFKSISSVVILLGINFKQLKFFIFSLILFNLL